MAKTIQWQAWLIENGHDHETVQFQGKDKDGVVTDWPVAETWPEGVVIPDENELPSVEEAVAMVEQARLNQVATEYAVPLQQFADAWAETGVETVPESWGDALTLLGQSGAGNDVFVRLLALRFGPLAPVWDDALTIMNGGM